VLEVLPEVREAVVDQAVQAAALRKLVEFMAVAVLGALALPLAVPQEEAGLCVLFGPELHGLIQPLTRGICNGTLYSNS
jgi:hypothetical protein